MKDERVTLLDLVLVHSTYKAYLIEDSRGVEAWIPYSQIEDLQWGDEIIDEHGRRVKEIKRMSLPEWLVEKSNIL